MTKERKHNTEQRSIAELPDYKVTRDGEVFFKGVEVHPVPGVFKTKYGERMTLQMFIFKAFPDIPLRRIPTW